jgi:hypothetical protein
MRIAINVDVKNSANQPNSQGAARAMAVPS